MTKAPIGTTRIGIAIFGIGGAALGAGFDLGLIFNRPLAEPVLAGIIAALGFWTRSRIYYRPDQYELCIVLIALLTAFWLALWVYAFVVQPARDRALDRYLESREEIEDSWRATTISEDDPPD